MKKLDIRSIVVQCSDGRIKRFKHPSLSVLTYEQYVSFVGGLQKMLPELRFMAENIPAVVANKEKNQ